MSHVDGDDADPTQVPANVTLASFPRRIGGLLIDEAVVLLPVVAVAVALGYRPGDRITDDALYAFSIGTSAVALAYETTMVGLLGRTIGKLATGTRVVHAGDGGRVGWGAAFMRSLVPVAFGAIPQVGAVLSLGVYALAFGNPRRQGLHDRAAGTLVVAA